MADEKLKMDHAQLINQIEAIVRDVLMYDDGQGSLAEESHARAQQQSGEQIIARMDALRAAPKQTTESNATETGSSLAPATSTEMFKEIGG